MIRTRFAPSPTGALHVGTLRTALFGWLMAQQANGQFVLRIEDTDQAREVAGAVENIMESITWLGITWQEGPDTGGPYAPYTQSQRKDIYLQWAQKLIDAGRAYADPTTPQELEDYREQAKAEKRPFLFRDHRPENPPVWDGKLPLRFKSDPKAYTWHDVVLGDLSAGPESVDDFIIIKSAELNGLPTYNFAHIVDDAEMKITHILRSQEFISSVPKYLNLYEALGIAAPTMATLPPVLREDGRKKLSKRDGAKQVLEYKNAGYLPEAMMNYIATLGWNDGTEQEIFSPKEILETFDISRVQKGGARFDQQRLDWMSGMHIRALPLEQLFSRIDGHFWPTEAQNFSREYRRAVLGLVQERLKYFSELPMLTNFFFVTPDPKSVKKLYTEPQDKPLKKITVEQMKPLLQAAHDSLQDSNFTIDDIAQRLNDLLISLQTKPGVLFSLIRIGVTGSAATPPIFDTLHTLGKEHSVRRLKTALELL